MNKNIEKCMTWNIQINAIMGFIMSFTSPVIHVYMIQSIEESFFKIVMFLTEVISVFIFFYIDKRDEKNQPVNLKKIRLHFLPVVICGCLCFIIANIFGMIDVRVRFLILASVEAFFSFLWATIMRDIFNQFIHATDLTSFTNRVGKIDRIGRLLGGCLILVVNLGIEAALVLQMIGYVSMGVVDYRIYKTLRYDENAYDKE